MPRLISISVFLGTEESIKKERYASADILLDDGTYKSIEFGWKKDKELYYATSTRKSKKRRQQFLDSYPTKEDWDIQSIETPAYWERWILWNKRCVYESIRDVRNYFSSLKTDADSTPLR